MVLGVLAFEGVGDITADPFLTFDCKTQPRNACSCLL